MKGVVKLQVSSGVNKVRKYFREHFRILYVPKIEPIEPFQQQHYVQTTQLYKSKIKMPASSHSEQ